VLFFGVVYRAVRRAMERDQRTAPSVHPPLWRLIAEEVVLLAMRVGRSLVSGVVIVTAAVVLAVLVAFAEGTPGPSLELALRAVAAALAGLSVIVAWAVVHALRRDEEPQQE
jgi:hypothetical protein